MHSRFLRLAAVPIAVPLACLYLLAALLPAQAQERAFLDLLSGKVLPLSVSLGSMDAAWRRITVASNGAVSGNVSVNVSGNSASALSQNNLTGAIGSSRAYVTQGETVTAAGHQYLVAYHLPAAGLDFSRLLQALATKSPPTAAALTLDSALPLSLLDLGSLGHLEDIRPFDAKAEIGESEKAVAALAELLKSQGGGGGSKTNSPPAPKPVPESGK